MHDLHDSWTLPRFSKEWVVIIFADSDTSIALRVPQMLRSFYAALFVLTTDRQMTTTTDKTDCMTPCACAWGKNSQE